MSDVNSELYDIFKADQAERDAPPAYGTPAYQAMRQRDRARRERVRQLATEDMLRSAPDFYYAALVLHHGGTVAEVKEAHTLARRALALGYRPARWLTAATLDRWLMYQGKPQKYGTQIVPDGRRQRVWDVDPTTSDTERARWDVRPLAAQQDRAAELSRTAPMPDMSRAPHWLREAIKRWAEKHPKGGESGR